MSDHVCKYCGKNFKSGQSLGAHTVLCKLNPNRNNTIKKTINSRKNNIKEHIVFCKICNKQYIVNCTDYIWKNNKYKQTCSSQCAHKLSVLNTNLIDKNNKITNKCKTSNKLNKHKKIIYRTCKYCHNTFIVPRLPNGILSATKYCCDEHRHNMQSLNAKLHKCGGLKPETTHKQYKRGYYNNIWYDSSWELAFLYYCNDNNITVVRNKVAYPYKYNGQILNFYPDFEIDGKLYEIKGIWDPKNKAKKEQYPNLIWIDKQNINTYIKYVKNKLGKNWVSILQENS